MSEKATFEERRGMLEERLLKMQEELKISLYAANIMMPNGEIQPMIKMADTEEKAEEVDMETVK